MRDSKPLALWSGLASTAWPFNTRGPAVGPGSTSGNKSVLQFGQVLWLEARDSQVSKQLRQKQWEQALVISPSMSTNCKQMEHSKYDFISELAVSTKSQSNPIVAFGNVQEIMMVVVDEMFVLVVERRMASIGAVSSD